MSKVLFIFLIFMNFSAFTQVAGVRDIIKDPALSYRCKSLLNDRNDKVKTKQKLKSMLQRTNKLLTQTPENKKTLIAKLTVSKNEISNLLHLTKLKISTMEENIIRRGCPGINL